LGRPFQASIISFLLSPVPNPRAPFLNLIGTHNDSIMALNTSTIQGILHLPRIGDGPKQESKDGMNGFCIGNL
jgi:hypothetical protein